VADAAAREPSGVSPMRDVECVSFLQWALPRMHLRWEGFRRVRRQVCRRIARRLRELELSDLAAYRAYLATHPGEWRRLDELCHVTISRFQRDPSVFASLERDVLLALARAAAGEGRSLAAWSAGCASGEEPYTLALIWSFGVAPAYPGLEMEILATDVDPVVLERAQRGCYEPGSLRDVPEDRRLRGFDVEHGLFHVRPELRHGVTLVRHDVRSGAPGGPFDLVLCRNLAFTYFDLELQADVCATLAGCLRAGGALVVGIHESLPDRAAGLVPWPGARAVYRRQAAP
jgi:chemotaxis protein methyltransferase CheR